MEAILEKIAELLVGAIWKKIEFKLNVYFEAKSEIQQISKEAGQLKEQLRLSSNDSERFAILEKMDLFASRIKF